MNQINRIASFANTILMLFASFCGIIMVTFGLCILYDIRCTNQTAYISHDLLKYRPKIQTSEENQSQFDSLAELKEINPDTVGWIELFDTHINYPLVQGDNNLEYLNKDIYGYSSLSGSIYLSAENSSDFNDWYNMIYGHHMENGAMFGDIHKYLDKEYFESHREGILQTENKTYLISIFACIATNAYETTVYNVTDNAENSYPALHDYIKENAVQSAEIPENMSEGGLIGMSTCSDAVTNGRIVLFAKAEPIQQNQAEILLSERAELENTDNAKNNSSRTVFGHSADNDRWAVLNFLCTAETFLIFMPFLSLKRKYGQISHAKRIAKEMEEFAVEDNKSRQTAKKLKRFVAMMRTGSLLEFLAFIVSVTVFFTTENLSKRMSVRDKWTGLMILITAVSLLIDYVCFRYHGNVSQICNSDKTKDNSL